MNTSILNTILEYKQIEENNNISIIKTSEKLDFLKFKTIVNGKSISKLKDESLILEQKIENLSSLQNRKEEKEGVSINFTQTNKYLLDIYEHNENLLDIYIQQIEIYLDKMINISEININPDILISVFLYPKIESLKNTLNFIDTQTISPQIKESIKSVFNKDFIIQYLKQHFYKEIRVSIKRDFVNINNDIFLVPKGVETKFFIDHYGSYEDNETNDLQVLYKIYLYIDNKFIWFLRALYHYST